jgi:glycosyltransferase involved in cell wall biosynthesis
VSGTPLVSVLTPSFNHARWLPENLRSVAGQSYRNIQHVVMDGGSTDATVGILEQAGEGVVWQSRPDQGQSDAINRAFRASSGDIIGWLNSDDAYFSRDVVARAVEAFESDPGIGVVYGHAARVDASGDLLYVLWTPPNPRKLLRMGYNPIRQPATFVRRSVVQREFFVDPTFDFMMDRELWLYLAGRTRFHHVNRILAVDRHHLQRKSFARLDLAAADREKLLERHGIPVSAPNRFLRQGYGLALRLAGLTKVAEAARGSDVLPMKAASVAQVARRQLGYLQRWNPGLQ